MKRIVYLLLCFPLFCYGQTSVNNESTMSESDLKKAVDFLNKIKISGYFQGQYQYGEKDATLKVGGKNTSDHSFNRIGIRRGRIKFTFDEDIFKTVFQLDMTDKGVSIKDAYVNLGLPTNKNSAVQLGLFSLPFGFEIDNSSTKRESPERAMVITHLFADNRDLGGMITLRAKKESKFYPFFLNLAITSGNGERLDIVDRKSFVTQLQAIDISHAIFTIGGGVSYYNGGLYQGTSKVYRMKGDHFELDDNSSNIGKYAKKEYFGINLQYTMNNTFGTTKLYSEYLWGTQPGSESSNKSYVGSEPPTSDTYIRKFRGGYISLVQQVGKYPLSIVCKYDWYDPNTAISGNRIGLNNTTKADISYHNIGTGFLWDIKKNIRLQTYYQWMINETSKNLAGYNGNRKDNLLTIRLQVTY